MICANSAWLFNLETALGRAVTQQVKCAVVMNCSTHAACPAAVAMARICNDAWRAKARFHDIGLAPLGPALQSVLGDTTALPMRCAR